MLNQGIVMGRFASKPVLKHTPSGTAICTFVLCVERDIKSDGERVTDFIDCLAWRGTAEFICKYFDKGRMAVATGRYQTRTWKDDNDKNHKSTELNIQNIYFADSKKEDLGFSELKENEGFSELDDVDEDLPY